MFGAQPRVRNPVGQSVQIEVVLGQDLRKRYGVENCPILRRAEDIAQAFEPLGDLECEVMMAGALDCQCRLVFCNLVSVGSCDGMMFRTSDVFFGAIKAVAPSIFLVHNHPSGSLTPSKLDWELTRSVARAAEFMRIAFVDHVIVSSKGYHSLFESSNENRDETLRGLARAAEPYANAGFGVLGPRKAGKSVHSRRKKT